MENQMNPSEIMTTQQNEETAPSTNCYNRTSRTHEWFFCYTLSYLWILFLAATTYTLIDQYVLQTFIYLFDVAEKLLEALVEIVFVKTQNNIGISAPNLQTLILKLYGIILGLLVCYRLLKILSEKKLTIEIEITDSLWKKATKFSTSS